MKITTTTNKKRKEKNPETNFLTFLKQCLPRILGFESTPFSHPIPLPLSPITIQVVSILPPPLPSLVPGPPEPGAEPAVPETHSDFSSLLDIDPFTSPLLQARGFFTSF